MTISTTIISKSYDGDGSNHSFAYNFKIFADADLTVIIRSSTGTETVKTLNTHYVVTGAGVSSGGNVLFKYNTGNASDAHYSVTDQRPQSGETVVIRSELANTQTLDLVANDPFPAETLETNLDKLVRMIQQHDEELDRSLKISRTNTMTSTEFTTSATDRANKLMAFDSAGEIVVTQEIGTFKGNWAASTAYAQRDIVKDTSTNNIFIVNEAHTSSGSQPLTTNANSAKYTLIVDAASATTSQNAAAASATASANSATAAASSASTATTKASEASTSASNAATSLATFQGQYHGAASSDPSSNLDTGDLYFNTSSGVKVYTGSAWVDVKPTSSEQTNINTVAGISSDVSTVAGKASLITTNFASGMSLVTSDFVSDVNTLATTDIVNDINLLATSDIVSDLNTLATSDIVSDINTLATSDIVSDLNTLATSDIVSDINTLATSDIVADLNLLGTSDFVSDLNTMATTANVNNLSTVASNISGVNSFGERYRVQSGVPSSNNDVGDLVFDTAANTLKVFGTSGFQNAGSSVNGTSNRFTYNITGTPTTVSGADANGETLAFDPPFLDVYLNGVKMSPADITVSSGNSVVFGSALAVGDVVDIVAFGTFQLANINASNINSGTIPSARFGGAIISFWETKTSAFNVEAGRGYFVDTSSSAITATLPASPTAGDTVRFIDLSATFDTNNLTVARNSKKIQGDASDLTVATERAGLALVFSGDTQGWLLMEK